MSVLITICARGGSKGIPGKNIKELNGKPLLHYTFKHAFEFAELHNADILLSTDDDNILNCANKIGYKTNYVRPAHLASDKAGKIEAIRDAWNYAEQNFDKEYKFLLDLDVSSPLRSLDDLLEAFEQLKKNENALNIFSVNPATKNPYFNMVEENSAGFVELVKKRSSVKTRQEAPLVFDMNASFYIYRRDYLVGEYQSSITEKSIAFVMDHICFDLDHPMDFKIMDLMLRENALGFDL